MVSFKKVKISKIKGQRDGILSEGSYEKILRLGEPEPRDPKKAPSASTVPGSREVEGLTGSKPHGPLLS